MSIPLLVVLILPHCCKISVLQVAAVLFTLACSTQADVHYVVARNGSSCPAHTMCHELSYYTNQPNQYFISNTILYFLEGTHELAINGHLVVEGVENLTLQGVGEMVSGFDDHVKYTDVVMNCTNPWSDIGNAGLVFMSSSNVSIQNITLVGCGYNALHTAQLQQYLLPLVMLRSFVGPMLLNNMSLVLVEVNNVTLNFVSIQDSAGFGLVVINGFDISISHSSYSKNNYYSFDRPCKYCYGGNAALLYTDRYVVTDNPEDACPTQAIHQLGISHTNFSYGVNLQSTAEQLNRLYVGRGIGYTAGGLYVGMEQQFYGVDMLLNSVIAYGNTGLRGANIVFESYSKVRYYTLAIINTQSMFSNRIYARDDIETVSEGGGLYIATGIATYLAPPRCLNPQPGSGTNNPITIINSNFTDNFAIRSGGVSINVYGATSVSQQQIIIIDSCYISKNIASVCMGLCINTPYVGTGMPTSFFLRNVTVSENKVYNHWQSTQSFNISSEPCEVFAVYLLTVFNCTMLEITVTDNEGTGMIVTNSGLQFLGLSNVFANNSGKHGGGVAMYGTSFFLLHPTTRISFLNNHASNFGGALYIDQTSVLVKYCSYQMVLSYEEFQRESLMSSGKVLVFSNNSAGIAGSVLFENEGSIETCLILPNSIISAVMTAFRQHVGLSENVTNGFFFFSSVLTQFSNQTGLSVISSTPIQACICTENLPNCSITNLYFSVYPGQSIKVPFVLLGQLEGIAPGVVRIDQFVQDNLIQSSLNDTDTHCTVLSYPIRKVFTDNSTMLTLQVNGIAENDQPLVSVNVRIRRCPLGFELTPSGFGICKCSQYITGLVQNVTCNITNLLITRLGNVWIGTDTNGSCLLVDIRCPFDYCDSGLVSFDLDNTTDTQCALNRSGVLCGGCGDGLSLLLGSNACGHCSNDYLTLLIPFALAGVALTAMLVLLNLTVSVGTINGLIFYANIVKLAEAVFLPYAPIPVLSQFVAWLNLDLGIQTCFYNGMDSYIKTWLQFIFPLYVWLIMIIISVVAKYSIVVSRLMGHNAISVLATLILLSYTKLFRTINLALLAGSYPCTTSTQLLWIVDANIPYFQNKHLALGVFALVVLILLAIPFTLILLFSSLVERILPHPCLWKINKFTKPFLDAYGGPYKNYYQFWTGLLLLVRLILLLIASFSDDRNSVLAAIITTAGILLTINLWLKGVYKNHYLNILESWFMMNLIFIAALASNDEAEIGAYISVTAVLATFLGIVCYHLYVKFKAMECTKKIFGRPEELDQHIGDHDNVVDHDARQAVPNTSVVIVRRRESLI